MQNLAAMFVTRNHNYEDGSMTGILEQSKWESPHEEGDGSLTHIVIQGLKGKARIPTDNRITRTTPVRNQHSMAFHIPSASLDTYKCSFFPRISGIGMT